MFIKCCGSFWGGTGEKQSLSRLWAFLLGLPLQVTNGSRVVEIFEQMGTWGRQSFRWGFRMMAARASKGCLDQTLLNFYVHDLCFTRSKLQPALPDFHPLQFLTQTLPAVHAWHKKVEWTRAPSALSWSQPGGHLQPEDIQPKAEHGTVLWSFRCPLVWTWPTYEGIPCCHEVTHQYRMLRNSLWLFLCSTSRASHHRVVAMVFPSGTAPSLQHVISTQSVLQQHLLHPSDHALQGSGRADAQAQWCPRLAEVPTLLLLTTNTHNIGNNTTQTKESCFWIRSEEAEMGWPLFPLLFLAAFPFATSWHQAPLLMHSPTSRALQGWVLGQISSALDSAVGSPQDNRMSPNTGWAATVGWYWRWHQQRVCPNTAFKICYCGSFPLILLEEIRLGFGLCPAQLLTESYSSAPSCRTLPSE